MCGNESKNYKETIFEECNESNIYEDEKQDIHYNIGTL